MFRAQLAQPKRKGKVSDFLSLMGAKSGVRGTVPRTLPAGTVINAGSDE